MLIRFFLHLKQAKLPCTVRELLDLIAVLQQQVVFADIDAFYHVSRAVLVKDESLFDRYDRAFSSYFSTVAEQELDLTSIPDDWLNNALMSHLSEEEKAQIKALGGFEQLMSTLRQRLAEQSKRHQGGSKWIGTGGTSPFGAYGYNPEGVRIGQHESRHRRAVKVWDQRQFKNLDSDQVINSRNMQMALRKLRQFARSGAELELDINATIQSTANNGGLLDIKMAAERHNAVKVLILFDVGGSMDDHVKVCQQLFTAVNSEFKHLIYYYFHNCVYEHLWQDNARRQSTAIDLWQVIHTYGRDYKLIIVGDATMGPYEITYRGGSVEHWNEEPGSVWMSRLLTHFNHAVWLNPQPEQHWPYYASIATLKQIMSNRMYPLTLTGIQQAIQTLLTK